MGILKQKTTKTSVSGPGSHLPTAVAQVTAFLLLLGRHPAARLRGHRGSARVPRERGLGGAVTFPPVHGMLNIAAASTTRRRFYICQKTLWLLARRWGQDDPRMLKAEKQLTTNRLHHDSEIPNEKRGRAAQQTDPASCRNPSARGNGAALSIPPRHRCVGWLGAWFAPAPRRGGAEEGAGINLPPSIHPVPLHQWQGPTTRPAQPGLRAETAAICLTFLAAHPNLKVTAPLCARYLYVRMAVTPI